MKKAREQVRLSDVLMIAKEYDCSMAQALRIVRNAGLCSNCLKFGMVEYNNGAIASCLFCDHTQELAGV